MPFSKRAQERKEQREFDRRQERLVERAAYELERQKEEARREQARLEYAEMAAALDAAKARKDELLARLRAQQLAERKTAEQKAAQQDNLLNLIRQAAVQANREQAALAEKEALRKERQAEEEKNARRKAALQERALTSRPALDKTAAKPRTSAAEKPSESEKEKRPLARKERQNAEQRAAARKARRAELSRGTKAAPDEAARPARLESQLANEKRAAARQTRLERLKELREANQKPRISRPQEPDREKLAAEREAENSGKLRLATLQARLEERRRLEESRRKADALRTASLAERNAENQRLEVARKQTDSRRASSLVERLAELRQAEAARKHAKIRRAAVNAERSTQLRQVDELKQKSAQLRKGGREETRRAGKRHPPADERRKSPGRERSAQRGEMVKNRKPAGVRQAEAQKATTRTLLVSVPQHNPLQDPLASGILSAGLPWLRASGNLVTNISGDPILLRGVNLLGFDSTRPDPELGFATGAGITPETIDTILSWGANVIRVAINRERVLSGTHGLSSQDYLSDLDGIIQRAAQGGAYTLLSLRRLDDTSVFGTRSGPSGQPRPNFIAPQPGFEHFEMWRLLGERYEQEPAVLFDLYTAPQAPLPDDTSGIESNWDLWTLWVEMSVADLRRVHPGALCFVSGLDGGTDLSGFPLLGTANRPIPNLVYTAHLYPRESNPWQAIQALARAHPLLVTEWGGQAMDASWGERAAQLLRGSGIGWTAAHWNAEPALTKIVNNRLQPSTFGALVRRALALEGEIMAVTQPAETNILPTLSIS